MGHFDEEDLAEKALSKKKNEVKGGKNKQVTKKNVLRKR